MDREKEFVVLQTHRRTLPGLGKIYRQINDEFVVLSEVYDSLYEARRGNTPTQLKRCVAAIVDDNLPDWSKEKPEKVRTEISRAFAICTKTLQRGGYMKSGTQVPTKSGETRGRSKAAEKGHSSRVKDYEKMLSVARGE